MRAMDGLIYIQWQVSQQEELCQKHSEWRSIHLMLTYFSFLNAFVHSIFHILYLSYRHVCLCLQVTVACPWCWLLLVHIGSSCFLNVLNKYFQILPAVSLIYYINTVLRTPSLPQAVRHRLSDGIRQGNTCNPLNTWFTAFQRIDYEYIVYDFVVNIRKGSEKV